MPRPLYGLMLLGVLALASSCRHSNPPPLSLICLLDGFGGADCVTASGVKKYLAPSETLNMWATTQADMSNFSAWCYDTNPKNTSSAMRVISGELRP
jgi:hypothetical protein